MLLKINNDFYNIVGDESSVNVAVSVINFISDVHSAMLKYSVVDELESDSIVRMLSAVLKENKIRVDLKYTKHGSGNIFEYNYTK